MATSGYVAVLFAFLLTGSLAATLHDASLIRREEKSVHVSSLSATESVQVKPARSSQECPGCEDQDYLVGAANSNECPDGTTKVTSDSMCRYAASFGDAHADDEHNRFNLQDDIDFRRHPYGCFYQDCHPDGDDTQPEEPCYFRHAGDEENVNTSRPDFSGKPICKRQRYVNGTTNGQGCGQHSDYSVVMDFAHCVKLCSKLGDRCAHHFEIAKGARPNFTQHHDYPAGCFWIKTAGTTEVFYNSESSGADGEVKGTPLCEVTSPMNWLTNPPTATATATVTDATG
jgi:hypothetical protein